MDRNLKLMSVVGIVLALIALILAGYMWGQQNSLLNRISTVESQVAAIEDVQAERQELNGVPREDFDQLADQVGALVQQVSQLEARLDEEADVPEPGEPENGEQEQDEDDADADDEADTEVPAE